MLEATRGSAKDPSVLIARRAAQVRRDHIRDFVARENSKAAEAVTDYVSSTMSGLSASAREGMSVTRLLAIARTAFASIGLLLSAKQKV